RRRADRGRCNGARPWRLAEVAAGRGARRRGLGPVAKGEFSMLYRTSLALAVLAALVLAPSPAASGRKKGEKDKNVHSGKFVKADPKGKSFMMTDKDGKNEHKMTLAPDFVILCDGKDCKLLDLREGWLIRVTTVDNNPTMARRVEAFTKET